MDPRAVFGIHVLSSLSSAIVIATLYVWPWLQSKDPNSALAFLVARLLFAFVQEARVGLEPGHLRAAFFIVTAIVPLMLVTHALIFLGLIKLRNAT